ncbi:hypothetical protein HanXRQr2_Chr16g0733111 [Helianthus annuus]|uniref:Uncharacterized protein n=1 Tax=Helianthus annuus TaxID=4232 RepID=A0A9K3DRF2_HELAN|nr:hypothetical protein HanXRQr2_Chr16g0733111 [Helianthus annuus]
MAWCDKPLILEMVGCGQSLDSSVGSKYIACEFLHGFQRSRTKFGLALDGLDLTFFECAFHGFGLWRALREREQTKDVRQFG